MTGPALGGEPARGSGSQDGSLDQLLGNVGVVGVALGVGKFLWSAGQGTVEVVGTVAHVVGTVADVAGTVVEVAGTVVEVVGTVVEVAGTVVEVVAGALDAA